MRINLIRALGAACLLFAPRPHTFCANSEAVPSKTAGVSYIHDEVSAVPWSIHVAKIDRTHAELQLQSTLGDGTRFNIAPLSQQLRKMPPELGKAIVAINGDFFDNDSPYEGDPKGLQIIRGELISAPAAWTCLWVDRDTQPHLGKVASQFTVTWPNGSTMPIGLNERRPSRRAVLYTHAVGFSTHTSGGREFLLEPTEADHWLPIRVGEQYSARIREVRNGGDTPVASGSLVLSVGSDLMRSLPKLETGAVLRISFETSPSIKGATAAISGGPALIHEKKAVFNSSQLRHPRSAVGWDKDFIYLVEVDGRQPNLSLGMTYSELTKYMLKLGCEEALNLDGGGSCTFWMLGQVMNSPCEGGERPIGNGLVIVQGSKAQSP